MSTQIKLILLLPVLIIFLNSCSKKAEEQKSTLKLEFSHVFNNESLVFNEMNYVNTAGNPLEITDLMYFISDVKLYRNGSIVIPEKDNNIHYIDAKMSETLVWEVSDNIPQGTYDSITFTFGLSEEINKSYLFVNPPEVNMAWPEVLGGGYHYLMMNGFWKSTPIERKPFNFHMGIGQVYANNSGNIEDITGFVHNNFTVRPQGDPLLISGDVKTLTVKMHIDSWFETPHIYDFNEWGGAIMQNQAAMHVISENGRDAFSVE